MKSEICTGIIWNPFFQRTQLRVQLTRGTGTARFVLTFPTSEEEEQATGKGDCLVLEDEHP